MARGLSCSTACEIFPDLLSLKYQGSPQSTLLNSAFSNTDRAVSFFVYRELISMNERSILFSLGNIYILIKKFMCFFSK